MRFQAKDFSPPRSPTDFRRLPALPEHLPAREEQRVRSGEFRLQCAHQLDLARGRPGDLHLHSGLVCYQKRGLAFHRNGQFS